MLKGKDFLLGYSLDDEDIFTTNRLLDLNPCLCEETKCISF